MTNLVVDASVAVKWFALEAESGLAKQVLRSGLTLLAPRLIVTEVANALARKAVAKLVDSRDARDDIAMLPTFLTALLDVDDLVAPAFQNACDYVHPIYDFIYLEAARRWETRVVTADGRFAAKVRHTPLTKYVILLSDWRSA